MVADTIGVTRSTARSIEGRIAERPCGGANNVHVDNEIKDYQNNNLNNNCMLTLTQINQELRRCLLWKPRINDRTVARTLDGMLFRFKIARRQPAERNCPDVIQKRHDYTNWFMGQAIVSHTVFVEECGYNTWTARSQRRTIRGERAYRQVCWQRGRNLTVALAISPTSGLVFHSAIIGGMNAQKFAQVVFIYDGTPAHHNPANPGPNTELKKLPPYSPFLNIVEQAISSLQAAIKADISHPKI